MFTFLTSLVVLLVLAAAKPRVVKEAQHKRESPVCGGVTYFGGGYGLIETPNYPQNYGDNHDCLYTIQQNDTNLRVDFYTCVCYIEDHSSCQYDYIMFGGNSTKVCGNKGDNTYSADSSDGVVNVRFHSDSSVSYVGCQIVFGVNSSTFDLVGRCPPRPVTAQTSNSTSPPYNGSTPSYNGSTPSYNGSTPSYNGSTTWITPSYNGSTPAYNGSTTWTTPSYNGSTPSYNGSTTWTTPSYNGSTPSYNDSTPSYDFLTTTPPNWSTTPSFNSSVDALLSRLQNLEFEMNSKFQEYKDLTWQILGLLMQV